MLLTYKNCGCCKKEMTDIKVLLNNIFPAGICDEICDYNLHCFKCKNLNLKENEFQKELCKGKHLTTPEKQIRFFKTEMPTPIFFIQHQPNKRPTNEKRNRCLAGHIQTQARVQTRQTVLNGD